MVSLKCGKYLLVLCTHLIGVTLVVKLVGFVFPFLTLYYYTGILEFITCLFVGVLTFRFTKKRYLDEKVHPNKKAVLITGCDSGFGHAFAKRLDSKGFRVFACCLFPSGDGATALRNSCSKKLEILELDVSKEESVKKVLEDVQEKLGNDVLWALVNNAGVLKGFTVEFSSIQKFRDSLEVNTIGPVRMVKTFLPMLRKSKGRIVNVTSLGGRHSIPFVTPYCMSKHATSAFNDCLRIELDVWGIRVIAVEPDAFQTGMTIPDKVFQGLECIFNDLDDDIKSEYGEDFVQKIIAKLKPFVSFASTDLDIMIDCMDSAVTDEYPQKIYRPRGNMFIAFGLSFYGYLCASVKDAIFKAGVYIMGFPKPKSA